MNIGASDDLMVKALDAVRACERAGRCPMKWIMGHETYDRLRQHKDRNYSTTEPDSLIGLPFVVNGAAPPTLLELDEF